MLKNLLALIPSERPARPVIDGAVLLTMTYGAHLDALSVAYETANVPIAAAGGAAVAMIVEETRQRALERRDEFLPLVGLVDIVCDGIHEALEGSGAPHFLLHEHLGHRLVPVLLVLPVGCQAGRRANVVPRGRISTIRGFLFSCAGPRHHLRRFCLFPRQLHSGKRSGQIPPHQRSYPDPP